MDDEILTHHELAALLKIGEKTAYTMVQGDELPGFKVRDQHPGANGQRVARADHTFQGLRVFGSESVVVTDDNGEIVSESVSDRRSALDASRAAKASGKGAPDTTPAFGEDEAIRIAMSRAGAKGVHRWQPSAELLIWPVMKTQRVAAALNDASGAGAKVIDVLRALGVNVRTSTGQTREYGIVARDAFRALSQIEDATKRYALAQRLLGTDGAKQFEPILANYKELNKELDQLGIGLDDLRSPKVEISSSDLAAVSVPVLVLTGATSHPAFHAVAHRLASGLADARFVELEGSGHVTYAERPDDFADAVAAFAAELDQRTPAPSSRPR